MHRRGVSSQTSRRLLIMMVSIRTSPLLMHLLGSRCQHMSCWFLTDLRRSPRVKMFARRSSNAFYWNSQPGSHHLGCVLSTSQPSDAQVKATPVTSPIRLLFGAAESPGRPSGSSHGRPTRSRVLTDSSVFEVALLFCQMRSTYHKYV